ncbi:4Fe-4S binding protein [Candidatus Sumerlaeota bacterium]|nr:4Fe-4S binding protein [Candidatus Sumerlaeota bacterium]
MIAATEPPLRKTRRGSEHARSLAFALTHVGFFTLIAQAVLIREFLVLYIGGEVALGVFYAAWLGWIGVGAAMYLPFAGRRGDARLRPVDSAPDARAVPWAMALLAPALLVELAAIRWGRQLAGVSAAEIVPLGSLALVTILATALVGLPAGFAFSAACRSAAARSRSEDDADASRSGLRWVALLFGFEAVGGFVGGLVYTFYLVDKLPPDGVAWLLAGLLGLHLAAWEWTRREPAGRLRRYSRLGLVGFGALLALGAIAQIALPSGRNRMREAQARRFTQFRPGLEFVDACESRYERLELARRGEQYTLFANGAVDFSFPNRLDARNRAAAILVQRPQGARRILLLGNAESGLLTQLLVYPSVERIDVVALNPRVADLVRPYLPEADRRALDDPRVQRVFADPRAFVNREAEEGAYDAVVMEAPDPISASVNRLYTLEFFSRVKQLLVPGGVLVTGVTSSANYLGSDVADYAGSVVATVRRVFPSAVLSPGDYMTIFACAQPGVVTLDAAELAARYEALERPASDVFAPEGFASLFPPKDVEAVRRRFAAVDAPVNTDSRPMTYYYGTIVWSRFSGSEILQRLLRSLERVGPGMLAVFLFLVLGFRLAYAWSDKRVDAAVRAARFDAVTTVGALGCVGMLVSILLIMAYQCSVGLLYERIGFLAALYMAGLALGSVAVGPWMARRLRPRPALLLIVGAMVAQLLAMSRLLPGSAGQEGLAMGLLAFAGLLAGGAFAASARVFADLPGRTGAWLDAADHTGGALGAVVTGAVAVPLLGFETTAWAGAAIALALVAVHVETLVLSRRRTARDLAESPASTAPPPGFSRPLRWVLSFVLLGSYLLGGWNHRETADAAPQTALSAAQIENWTGETSWVRREGPIPHWETPGTTPDEKRRVVFSTDHTAGDIRGFVGPITLAIEMDRSRLRGVHLIRSDETPSYVADLADWLKGFSDRPADRGLVLGRDIDAITGASVTSRAVVDTINRSVYHAGRTLLELDLDPDLFEQPSWKKNLLSLEPILVGVCFLLFFPVYRWGGDRLRLRYLILVAAVLGFWLNREFTLIEVGGLALGQIPSPQDAAKAVMIAGVLIVTLLLGNAFCGYICPFGALQELVSRFARGGESQRHFLNARLRRLRTIRYVLATLALAGFFLTWGDQRWVTWSPLETAFSRGKPALLWGSVLAAVAMSLAVPRLWCLCLCPVGAVLSVFNRFSLLRRTRLFRKPDYTMCDLGATATRPRECLRCNRCLTLAARPRALPGTRGAAAVALFALACVLMAVVYWGGAVETIGAPSASLGASQVGPAGAGRVMSLDVRAVDKALESGQLSNHEAMYYRPAPTPSRETPKPEQTRP